MKSFPAAYDTIHRACNRRRVLFSKLVPRGRERRGRHQPPYEIKGDRNGVADFLFGDSMTDHRPVRAYLGTEKSQGYVRDQDEPVPRMLCAMQAKVEKKIIRAQDTTGDSVKVEFRASFPQIVLARVEAPRRLGCPPVQVHGRSPVPRDKEVGTAETSEAFQVLFGYRVVGHEPVFQQETDGPRTVTCRDEDVHIASGAQDGIPVETHGDFQSPQKNQGNLGLGEKTDDSSFVRQRLLAKLAVVVQKGWGSEVYDTGGERGDAVDFSQIAQSGTRGDQILRRRFSQYEGTQDCTERLKRCQGPLA